YFDRPWSAAEKRATRLVVIGLAEMDQAAVRAAIEAALSGAQAA
ncbi:MAG: GTP-binding protein, partial [Pararhizobium sp.]